MLNPGSHESPGAGASGDIGDVGGACGGDSASNGAGTPSVGGLPHPSSAPLSNQEPEVIHTRFNLLAKEHERSELDGMTRSQRNQWTVLERSIAGNACVALTKQEVEHQVSSQFFLTFMTLQLKSLSS